jgi:hypothetical protein
LTLGALPRVASSNSLKRCGTPSHTPSFSVLTTSTDCDSTQTILRPEYGNGGLREFRLVVHVIENADGSAGAVSDALIQSQVDVLNEDFRALAGSLGEAGVDIQFGFALADTDPDGNRTTGITRHNNDVWFTDFGSYWHEIAWDPARYINVYTNEADGYLGYSYLPAYPDSAPGLPSDRVVIHWQSLGRNSPNQDGYDLGRTLTHELGHYFGLEHTFEPNPTDPETFQCAAATSPECYQSGDLICDTPSEDSPNESCNPRMSCGTASPIGNYMNYTPDACLEGFTSEQRLRMRCTFESYRASSAWPSASLKADVTTVRLPPGENAIHSIEVVNSGSVATRFELALASQAGSLSPHFANTGTSTFATEVLAPRQSAVVNVQVPVPLGAAPGEFGDYQLSAVTPDNSDRAARFCSLAPSRSSRRPALRSCTR